MKISGFRRRFPRFHEGFGISQGFPNFVWDFKISSEISAKPYEISASGGPLGSIYIVSRAIRVCVRTLGARARKGGVVKM